jgi:NAD(P)-dependent dehydrogenase (short-subunit alcohol dehydrogenase family)
MKTLEGKSCSSGIGLATAKLFQEVGAKVAVLRTEPKLA